MNLPEIRIGQTYPLPYENVTVSDDDTLRIMVQ